MASYEIPLDPRPQQFTIALSGVEYRLRFHFANAEAGGWLLDISDTLGNPIVCGIPLLPGQNLLEQYGYLSLGGELWLAHNGNPGQAPGFNDLGVSARLYWIT